MSESTIKRRLKNITCTKGKNRINRIVAFYSEDDVRKICKDLLQKLPQPNLYGFFMENGEKYGTATNWAREFGVSDETTRKRLEKISGIEKRIKSQKIHTFYSESDARKACADLLQNIPKADDDGFFEKDGIMYATKRALSKKLGISQESISKRLKGIQSVKGKIKQGHACAFYPEHDVRNACADLIKAQELPHTNESGFFEKSGMKYRTTSRWAEELGISEASTRRRLVNLPGIKGLASSGNICTFYSESNVLKACVDLIKTKKFPKADKSGFYVKDAVRYSTIGRWAKELGISEITVKNYLKSIKGISGIKVKLQQGFICTFYSEADVRKACADIIKAQELPQADIDDFFEIEGERYGTVARWEIELNISDTSIKKRLKGIAGVKGRVQNGQVSTYYPESAVRAACIDIIEAKKLPQVNKDGFFEKGGMKYRTASRWAEELGITLPTVKKRLKNIHGIKGRNLNNTVYMFYPEPAVLEACADILAKKLGNLKT